MKKRTFYIIGMIAILIYFLWRFVLCFALYGNVPGQVLVETYRLRNGYPYYSFYRTDATGIFKHEFQDIPRSSNVHWSPDNTKIAYECSRLVENGYIRALCYANADGTDEIRPYTPNYSLGEIAWGPDSEKIAFTKGGNLFSVDINTKIISQLTNIGKTDWWPPPAWSPDGTKIAFVSDEEGAYNIYLINIDGSEKVNLTQNSDSNVYNHDLVWFTDGETLLFISGQVDFGAIHKINLFTLETEVLTDPPLDISEFSLSPDETKIAYVSYGEPFGNGDIYVLDLENMQSTKLTSSKGFDGHPSWSPDGKNIAYVSEFLGAWRGFIMKADGSWKMPIAFGEYSVQDIVFSNP